MDSLVVIVGTMVDLIVIYLGISFRKVLPSVFFGQISFIEGIEPVTSSEGMDKVGGVSKDSVVSARDAFALVKR